MPVRRARMRTKYRPLKRAAVKFQYKEQFGVIVICHTEPDQRRIYHKLTRQGLACKVVVV